MRGLEGVLLVNGGVLWKGLIELLPLPHSLLLPGSEESGLAPCGTTSLRVQKQQLPVDLRLEAR